MVEELILSGADIIKVGIGPGTVYLSYYIIIIILMYIRFCLYY